MPNNNESENNRLELMLGYLCIATEIESSLVRKVEILDKFGLKDADISKICSCTVQAVRNARQLRKKNKKK